MRPINFAQYPVMRVCVVSMLKDSTNNSIHFPSFDLWKIDMKLHTLHKTEKRRATDYTGGRGGTISKSPKKGNVL
jgi:hypothetical protein